MNIGDFLHSRRWKLIQNYIYSWGASVVLIGALFKLEHLSGAGAFLGIGLSIEAIIFFVSAFEPMMDTPDWKKVYPQLRTGEESDSEIEKFKKIDELYGTPSGGGNVQIVGQGGGKVTLSGSSGGGGSLINNLPEEQIKLLNDSLQKLSETARGIKDITSATTATDSFIRNLNEASQSIGKVVVANEKMSAETEKVSAQIGQSASGLTDSYKATADAISASGKKMTKDIEQTAQTFNTQLVGSTEQLKSSYKEMTDSLTGGFKGLDKNSGKYIENIEKMNKNLAALNTVYEIQLQGSNKVEAMVGEYSKGVAEVNKLIQKSIEETKKFNESTKEISENIQALNKVYGNMLGALNVKK